MTDTTGLFQRIEDALEMNHAVYQLFLNVGSGDVDAAKLSEMTNNAIALNTEALALLKAMREEVPEELTTDLTGEYKHMITATLIKKWSE